MPLRRLVPGTLLGVFVLQAASLSQALEVRALSSRPETVSGGEVLVQVIQPNRSAWIAKLNGRDVTPFFRAPEGADNPIARLTGLIPGENTLEIHVNGRPESKLTLVNHAEGPIFSGPHQQPFICQTEANGLGPALDSNCNARPVIHYYYKSTESARDSAKGMSVTGLGDLGPGFKVFDPSRPFPSDVAQTVTSEGRTVSYIIRREIGTINRAVYEIQFLNHPGQTLPTPWTPTPAWNGRLVYNFGGGCAAGYRQGKLDAFSGAGPMKIHTPTALSQGYAVATSTLNIFANNCNDKVSAETAGMVKEYFIKRYGKPIHTIGYGGSGGAMAAQLIAQNHQGLLDGIIVQGSFPDVLTYIPKVTDCALLRHAFGRSKKRWTEEQQTAVSGYATWRTCKRFPVQDAKNCHALIPAENVYDRQTNPDGVRCDLYSNYIGVIGRNPKTGLAYRALDNVGVQYGLVAFNSGRIDAEQFVDLNERIGGFDEDGNIVAHRTEASHEVFRIVYERGLVLTGRGGLSQIPIIDWHSYTGDQGDNHVRLRGLQTRARLIAANGTAENQVILITPSVRFKDLWPPEPDTTEFLQLERNLVLQMDRWLDSIAADKASGRPSQKVARNRPAELSEGCWQVDGKRILERATYDQPGKCNAMYPPHGDPQIAAGAPMTGLVLKCALKPINSADYSQPLTPDQLARLRAVFPGGVCDYSRPGAGEDH